MIWDSLPWILVVLSIITPALAFAEWLVGDEGVARAKSRLADWYVYVEEGDLTTLISCSAQQTEAFLRRLLGSKLFSKRSVVIWFAISCCLSATAFSVNHTVKQFGLGNTVGAIFGVFAIDFGFLILGRIILRRLTSTSDQFRAALGFLAYSIFASYLGVGIFIGFGNYLSVGNDWHLHLVGSLQLWIAATLAWPRPLVHALSQGRGTYMLAGYIILMLPAALSSLLFGSVVTVAWVVASTEKRSRKIIALIIERVASLKGGALTAISTSVTAVVAIVTAFEHTHRT